VKNILKFEVIPIKFEVNMKYIRQSILGTCVFAYSAITAQTENYFEFKTNFKKGEKFTYQLAETKFKQNQNGQYLYLQYDTTYMMFEVAEKNDSNTIINLNYADAIYNGIAVNDPMTAKSILQTETYQLVFAPNGEFIELQNWDKFAQALINNIKISYFNKEIDSNTLKYYYVFYHNQENVEKTVIPRILDLMSLYGESYNIGTNYYLAKEVVNPFGGMNLMKSVIFKASIIDNLKNSVFMTGKVETDNEDNETLQEDYYNYINEKKPNIFTEAAPYIYITDSYQYQYGNISNRILQFNTTHTVYLGQDSKQGLDRTYKLVGF